MDLFASHLNYKVSPFCAYQPDPLAHTIDAFNLNWHGFLGYAFPPFCLLGKIMQKIIRDDATVIVVAPFWPTKPWYTLFCRMLVEEPLKIYVDHNTLCLPHRNEDVVDHSQRQHPMTGSLTLMVGKLSGNHYF